MYLWVPQTVASATRNIDCDLSASIPTQPTQVNMDFLVTFLEFIIIDIAQISEVFLV